MSGASGAAGCVSGKAGTPPTRSLRRAAVHGNGAVAEGTARSKARRRSAGLRVEQAPRRARRAGTRGRTTRQRLRPRLGLATASRAPPAGPCATFQGAHFRGPLSANAPVHPQGPQLATIARREKLGRCRVQRLVRPCFTEAEAIQAARHNALVVLQNASNRTTAVGQTGHEGN
jgi:hypothetical protein